MSEEKPGDLPDETAPQSGLGRPPATQPSQRTTAAEFAPERHGLTVQPGGGGALAGTAERIGSALGDAQRRLRHGLELVHPAMHDSPGEFASDEDRSAEQAEMDWAGRMIQAIEEEAAGIRRQAAGRLISLEGSAEERLHSFRELFVKPFWWSLCDVLHRTRRRARQLATEHPLRTTAAITGFFLLFVAALHLRRPHRE